MHWPTALLLVVAVESLLAEILAASFGLRGGIPWLAYYSVFAAAASVAALSGLLTLLVVMFRSGVKSPSVHMLEAIRGAAWAPVVFPLVALPALMASYTAFKVALPHLTSFWADAPLAKLDRIILGRDAWELTHALFGPTATLWIDWVYTLWFPVTLAMLLAVLFVPRLSRYRGQVFLTYALSWVALGLIMAILLASVGPCFYEAVHGDPRYAGLTARLAEQPLNAALAQNKLLSDHSGSMIGFGSGISAMPSMHVSVAMLTALLLRKLGWGWLGCPWLGLIYIGSIHLGWHYASDGIVAMVGTVLIWRALEGVGDGVEVCSSSSFFGRIARARRAGVARSGL